MTSNRNPPLIKVGGREYVPDDVQHTVLETLEKHAVDIQYHCREGFCGACRCKLLQGQVDYTLDPLAFVDDDEILACCTRPVTDVEIQLD